MSRQGFSLLELSVVLTIIAIVVAGGLTLGTAKTQQNKLINTYDEMKEIAEAISVFVNDNGCMPYPADQTATPGSATYGREPAANALCSTTPTDGSFDSGGVPFYSLGLPDEYGVDDYGVRYTYVVVDTATVAVPSSYAGTITVNDEGGNPITAQATFVLISHGKTRKGGYTVKTGAIGTACDATNLDLENCDGDGVFIDAPLNDGEVAASFFDDIVLWKTTSGIYAYGAGSGSGSGSGGYPVPSAIAVTSASSNGNFTDYAGMASFINANGCSAASNYKVCTPEDLTRYFHENGESGSSGWVSGGNANENCAGWSDGTAGANGTMWRGPSDEFGAEGCHNSHPVFCCQWN